MDTRTTETIDNRFERSSLQVTSSAATHVGKVRGVNEDGFVAAPGIWAVVDGMGGHAAGRVASEIVVDICRKQAVGQPMSLEDVPMMLDEANREVREHAHNEGHEMMGATICGIALVDNGGDDALLVFNVGDSRCYQFVAGDGFVQLTTDHSYVQELIDRGEIAPEDARHHPNRNVVSRAIGIEDSVSADFLLLSNDGPSRLLLCSDGVSGELEDDTLAGIVEAAPTPADAAAGLLDEVVAGPARDNATVVVLDVSWHRREPDSSSTTDSDETTVPRDEGQHDDAIDGSEIHSEHSMVIDRVPGFVATDPVERTAESLVERVPSDLSAQEDAAT